MSDRFVYPRRNLPDVSENWGRSVEGQVESVKGSVSALSSTVGNQGRASAGAFSVLGEQVEALSATVSDLSGRTAYMGEPWLGSVLFNTNGTHVLPLLQPLLVSLPEPRVVKVESISTLSINHTSAAGAVLGEMVLFRNGVEVPATEGSRATLNASAGSKTPSSSSSGVALLQLPAGDHEFTARLRVQLSGATGSVSIGGTYLIADVFQRI